MVMLAPGMPLAIMATTTSIGTSVSGVRYNVKLSMELKDYYSGTTDDQLKQLVAKSYGSNLVSLNQFERTSPQTFTAFITLKDEEATSEL